MSGRVCASAVRTCANVEQIRPHAEPNEIAQTKEMNAITSAVGEKFCTGATLAQTRTNPYGNRYAH